MAINIFNNISTKTKFEKAVTKITYFFLMYLIPM